MPPKQASLPRFRGYLRETDCGGLLRHDFHSLYDLAEEPLGCGSYSEVFLAHPKQERDPTTGADSAVLAIKVIVAKAGKPSYENVWREVSLLRWARQHPNILQFHGLFQLQQQPEELSWAIATEYCPGGDLLARLQETVLSEPEARHVMKGVLSALSHLHDLHIIHRDVKVDNVLFRSDGEPVLADFGVACHVDDEAQMARRPGTPSYVAPEIYLREAYSFKADIFSAGALTFGALFSRVAFPGTTLLQVARRTLQNRPNYGLCTSEAEAFMELLMEKSPDDRPTAKEALKHRWILNRGDADEEPAAVPPCAKRVSTTGRVVTDSCWHGNAATLTKVDELAGAATDVGNPEQLIVPRTASVPIPPRAGTPSHRGRFQHSSRRAVPSALVQSAPSKAGSPGKDPAGRSSAQEAEATGSSERGAQEGGTPSPRSILAQRSSKSEGGSSSRPPPPSTPGARLQFNLRPEHVDPLGIQGHSVKAPSSPKEPAKRINWGKG